VAASDIERQVPLQLRREDRRMGTTQAIEAKVEMLIRKPAAQVFEALVDPAITSKFWFTRGSGRLETGRKVTWDWEMYGLSIQVQAKVVEPNRRIVYEWGVAGEAPTTVE
jgi:uncharacterized protein YndB with AHSA1/START domain